MKFKLLRHIAPLVFAGLFAACAADIDVEPPAEPVEDDEYADVTFSVNTGDVNTFTRADGENNGIGSGSNVDMLIYAVYILDESKEVDGDSETLDTGDGRYVLLTQYSKGIDKSLAGCEALNSNSGSHTGQTILNIKDPKNLNKDGEVEIVIRLMRRKKYRLAIWAQNSRTDAYDTNNLRLIKVNYNGKNNDDNRDAFCKVEVFSVSNIDATRKISLTRPFAQINVATTDDDFKDNGKDAAGTTLTHSQISLEGVPQYMDLVRNKVLNEEELKNYLEDRNYFDIPEDENIDENALVTAKFSWNVFPEEGLNVNLIMEDGKTAHQSLKYLSMCYVLVPDPVIDDSKWKEEDVTDSDGNKYVDKTDPTYDEPDIPLLKVEFSSTGTGAAKMMTVEDVKVQRNLRTNILGGVNGSNSIFGNVTSTQNR